MFFEAPSNIALRDNNTHYTYLQNMQIALCNDQEALEKIFSLYPANYLVANAYKCHQLTSFKTTVYIDIYTSKKCQ